MGARHCWRLRAGLFGLRFRRETRDDGPLPLRVFLPLQAIIGRRQQDMSVDEVGSLLNHRLEEITCLLGFPEAQVRGCHDVTQRKVVRAESRRALQVGHGLFEPLIEPVHISELQVRVEVIRILRDRGAEGTHRLVSLAHAEERAAVQQLHGRKLGIQLDGAGELLDGVRIVLSGQVRHAHEQTAFGGFSPLKNAIDKHLPASNVVQVQRRRPEQIGKREIVTKRRVARPEKIDDLLISALLHQAIRQQKRGLFVLRVGVQDTPKLRNRVGAAATLVEGKPQIEANLAVVAHCQRARVFGDSLVEPAEGDQRGGEIQRMSARSGATSRAT